MFLEAMVFDKPVVPGADGGRGTTSKTAYGSVKQVARVLERLLMDDASGKESGRCPGTCVERTGSGVSAAG